MSMRPEFHLYTWIHIPTDVSGVHETDFPMSRLEFLEQLNSWNRHFARPIGTMRYVYVQLGTERLAERRRETA